MKINLITQKKNYNQLNQPRKSITVNYTQFNCSKNQLEINLITQKIKKSVISLFNYQKKDENR